MEAAEREHTAVPGEVVIAQLVRTLAQEVQALNVKAPAPTMPGSGTATCTGPVTITGALQ